MAVSDAQSARVQAQFGVCARFYTTSNVHARGESLARLVDMVQPASRDVVLEVATGAGHSQEVAPHTLHRLVLQGFQEITNFRCQHFRSERFGQKCLGR